MNARRSLPASLACTLLVVVAGCSASGPGGRAPARSALADVSLPDLSRSDRAVQEQARERYATLTARMTGGASDHDLGTAYGEFGMLLQAAEYYEAAEPSLLNAQALVPGERRWPYYLGHLYRSRGDLARAESAFARALELAPDDLATLIWLGRLHLDRGNLDRAETFFSRASSLAPRAIAVLAGMGRVELGKRQYANAVRHFEEALRVDPEGAESLHAPLAVAYRGLGDSASAERHERQWANRDILVPDPLSQELDMLLDNGLSNELRGVRSLEANDWKTAAGYFRRGLAVTPENSLLRRSLQHKLGTALYLGGDVTRAAEEFEQVIAAAPPSGLDEATAKAHYSLGVIDMSQGRYRDGIAHFQGAIAYQSVYLEARLALAEALRRTGAVAASLPHYENALEINPQLAQARLGYSFALIHEKRFLDARRQLDEAVTIYPDRPEFTHMLARLLAVAPDARVRDGTRAMSLVDELMRGPRTTELGETLAMVLAEVGDYERAAGVQREILAVARRAGAAGAVRRIETNLRLYESHQPCRTFWESDPPPSSGLRIAGQPQTQEP